MSDDNPFQVSSDSYGDRSGRDRDVATAEVTPRTIEMLNQTRPWVQLIGVLLWIGTVLLAIGAIVGFFVGLAGGGAIPAMLMSAVYGIFVLVYGSLARSLTRYAKSINALNSSERVRDLEDAMESQKTFWRLAGIITLVTILIYLGLLVLLFAGFGVLGNMFGQ